MTANVNLSVQFGSDPEVVTIRASGRSKPFVASLLGADLNNENKPYRLYLRELLPFGEGDAQYSGWVPSGAVSTILTLKGEVQ